MNEWSWWHENLKCSNSDYTWYNAWTHTNQTEWEFETYLHTFIHEGEVYVKLWVDFLPVGIYTHQEWV